MLSIAPRWETWSLGWGMGTSGIRGVAGRVGQRQPEGQRSAIAVLLPPACRAHTRILPRILRQGAQLQPFAGALVNVEIGLGSVTPGNRELHRRADDGGPFFRRAVQG